MSFSLQDKIDWEKISPDDSFPIYDMYFKRKTPPVKVPPTIWIAAFMERAMPVLKHQNLKGVFADNRKRPFRLGKKIIFRRLGFKKSLPNLPPFVRIILRGVLEDMKKNKSPYMQDQMMDLVLGGFNLADMIEAISHKE